VLKVLIDARKLNDGGIGSYLRSLLEALTLHSELNLSVLVPKLCTALPETIFQIVDTTKPYSISEYVNLGRKISAKHEFDLFHSPHFTLPYFIKAPAVVTVHDTIHLTHPQSWYYPHVSRFLISSAVERAKAVISVSEESKQSLLRNFGAKHPGLENRINVVENAAPAWLTSQLTIKDNSESIAELPNDFLFAVFSQNKAHKGLADLLKAYSELKFEQRLPDLLLAGYGIEQYCQEHPEELKDFSSLGIHLLGSVSQATLRKLYANARALILPSLVEGFGLMALEAKVLGCPILSRPLPSVQQMLDSQDRVCADMSYQALKAELAQVARNFPIQQNREINVALAEKYSLEKLAAKTMAVYRQALGV
jgi:glycosyltransferase involved in cell wall biosynthesis